MSESLNRAASALVDMGLKLQDMKAERDAYRKALERVEVVADICAKTCRDIGNDRAEQFDGIRDIARAALAGKAGT